MDVQVKTSIKLPRWSSVPLQYRFVERHLKFIGYTHQRELCAHKFFLLLFSHILQHLRRQQILIRPRLTLTPQTMDLI